MKRRLTKLVVFLLLGAIVNVAVAWGCAILIDLRVYTQSPSFSGYSVGRTDSGHSWTVLGNERRGGAIIGSYVEAPGQRSMAHETRLRLAEGAPSLRVPSWSRAAIPKFDPAVTSRQAQVVEGFGWPWLSLWVSFHEIRPSETTGTTAVAVERWTGLAVSSGAKLLDPPRALPLGPIWSGFAINTVFYAATLWLLALGTSAVRRVIRRKRGHCINCGYDLRGASGGGGVCPECVASGRSPRALVEGKWRRS
ncbi:MAG: hypothetical protein V3T53_04740 [Phycisphaerales bacterium]